MLKKAGFVAVAAAGLMMVGGTAFAAETNSGPYGGPSSSVSYGDAYHQFIEGGGALGYGAASLVAGAYTAIIETPQNVYDNAKKGGVLGN